MVQLLHSIKYSMEVPFSNMAIPPQDKSTSITKKVRHNFFFSLSLFLFLVFFSFLLLFLVGDGLFAFGLFVRESVFVFMTVYFCLSVCLFV